jgi:hypothetical protein
VSEVNTGKTKSQTGLDCTIFEQLNTKWYRTYVELGLKKAANIKKIELKMFKNNLEL